ncbi:FtsL-like putative cell division protein [Pontimicrobium aquaticum]|uniref:S-adenosyl-methyltransferase n=1 Tax=Pontimicrobium aquaticum TaxID=2565367 RepID=A0A4U0EX27_9FLAO|nr:FtsL-like putative cell division protein [Pontimicrobium aquaticum]TJY36505.1 S-adenosyl-methyltransferase [Pontimicrobium aquaticum]
MAKKKFYNILKGTFLVSDDSFKNWRMIIFLSFLAVVMIASSHSADRKVHEIARLNEEVKAYKSIMAEVKKTHMELKMESTIRQKLANKGVLPSAEPPKKIKVKSQD